MAALAVAAKGLGCEMGLFFVRGEEVMRALAMNKSRSRTLVFHDLSEKRANLELRLTGNLHEWESFGAASCAAIGVLLVGRAGAT